MIVLSSPAAVRAVLDKKGNSTGGRPRNLMWSIFQGLYLSFENAGVYSFLIRFACSR